MLRVWVMASSIVLPLLAGCGHKSSGVRPLGAAPRPITTDPQAQPIATDPLQVRPSGAATAQLPPGPLHGVRGVSAGHGHACALLTEGRVACWGANGVGQAGAPIVGDTPSRPHLVAGLPEPIVEVVAGSFQTCALGDRGGVWCWGRPDLASTRGTTTSVLGGASGDGAETPRRVQGRDAALEGVRSLVLSLASPVTCAVGVDELHCWRANSPRKEGRVELQARRWPGVERVVAAANVLCGIVRGAEGGRRIECARAADAPTSVLWPASAREPVSLSFGTLHLCALDAAGSLLCWRAGVDERWWQKAPQAIRGLGGAAVSVSAGGDFACAAARDGSVGCFLAEQGGLEEETIRTAWAGSDQVARKIPGVVGAREVSAGVGRNVFGHGFACAVTEDATAVCWGDDESGQLGGAESPSQALGVVVTAP